MTKKEAIEILKNEIRCVKTDCERVECQNCHLVMSEIDIISALNMAITALDNVQEVRHGEWINTGSGEECSVCGEFQPGYDNYRFYCSNCGAIMDGKESSNHIQKIRQDASFIALNQPMDFTTLLNEDEFIEKYCHNCGTQRCEGIGTEWFKGCYYRNALKGIKDG